MLTHDPPERGDQPYDYTLSARAPLRPKDGRPYISDDLDQQIMLGGEMFARFTYGADGQISGLILNHRTPSQGTNCEMLVSFTGVHMKVRHDIITLVPLHVSPAIRCPLCGLFGEIRGGEWLEL